MFPLRTSHSGMEILGSGKPSSSASAIFLFASWRWMTQSGRKRILRFYRKLFCILQKTSPGQILHESLKPENWTFPFSFQTVPRVPHQSSILMMKNPYFSKRQRQRKSPTFADAKVKVRKRSRINSTKVLPHFQVFLELFKKGLFHRFSRFSLTAGNPDTLIHTCDFAFSWREIPSSIFPLSCS